MSEERWPPALWAAGGLFFVLLATANSGGYRYGSSDQAFHIPAVVRALDPSAFPHDTEVIDSQGRLMVFHEAVAAVIRLTGASMESVFFSGYLLSLALVWLALLLIGTKLFANPWATLALAAIVTLRHRIPRTTANSIEPYFSPRMLAFAIGLFAVAALLRRRTWTAALITAVAAIIHVTTGLWFAILVGVAVLVLEPRLRAPAAVAAVVGATIGVLALAGGSLAVTTRLDSEWLAALESKSDLFPSEWPAWAWAANLALPALLWWVHRMRAARGHARREDAGLVYGALALAGVFLLVLPGVMARFAMPTALQASRVFWVIDFVAAVYLIALASERLIAPGRRTALRGLVIALVVLSAGRAAYVMLVEFPERSLFEVRLRDTPWQDAMTWLKQQPPDVHVWADPGHAWKYGTSVRVAAERDVFLEESKDSALALYSRDLAMRVIERRRFLAGRDLGSGGSGQDSAAELARELRERFDVDYLVTEARLDLPLVYDNSQFHIYATGAR